MLLDVSNFQVYLAIMLIDVNIFIITTSIVRYIASYIMTTLAGSMVYSGYCNLTYSYVANNNLFSSKYIIISM